MGPATPTLASLGAPSRLGGRATRRASSTSVKKPAQNSEKRPLLHSVEYHWQSINLQPGYQEMSIVPFGKFFHPLSPRKIKIKLKI